MASPLRQVFILLLLVTIGHDIRLVDSSDTRAIRDEYFSPEVHVSDLKPCFIRSQLGEVFSQLATRYMKDILRNLEIACLSKDCRRFPLIMSSFLILFMVIEIMQYHNMKDSLHSMQYSAPCGRHKSLEDTDAIEDLLRFYRNCFGNCHARRVLEQRVSINESGENSSRHENDHEQYIVSELSKHLADQKEYLLIKASKTDPGAAKDIAVVIDRLVARFLLSAE